MALSNELVTRFNEAKAGNFDAINFFINYFINNVEIQLYNLKFSLEEKNIKINQCWEIIIRNLHNNYDANNFIEQTLRDIKNIIYLNQMPELNGSKKIIDSQKEMISSKLKTLNLNDVTMTVKEQELARLFYIENKSIDELKEIFKCSSTLLYFKLRKIADTVLGQQMSNSVQTEMHLFTTSKN